MGYKHNYDLYSFTVGFGVKVPIPGIIDMNIDYAYQDMDIMGDTHRISLILLFGKPDKGIVHEKEEIKTPLTEEEKFKKLLIEG